MQARREAFQLYLIFVIATALILILLMVCVFVYPRAIARPDFSPEFKIPSGCTLPRLESIPDPVAETLSPTESDMPTYTASLMDSPWADLADPDTLRWRVGVGIPDGDPHYFTWPEDRPGWYLNWSHTNGSGKSSDLGPMQLADDAEIGMHFMPMVHTNLGQLTPDLKTLAKLAASNPHRTWLMGNEPDVVWQDNTTPEEYAMAYYCAYSVIKYADPTAQIAIGGLSQITPLRLEYLDRVWDYYQAEFGEEMPVDVWNMHAFVLREERDEWGVGIPPGFEEVDQGALYEIEDHDDLQKVEEQIYLMRQWMADHGQRQKPLWITEYGILLSDAQGFEPELVANFMGDTFNLFNTLQDPELGYSDDEERLVQRWNWFSARYRTYPTGNLFNSFDEPTLLMRTLESYLQENQ